MSRIGNAVITIPEGVAVDIQQGGDFGNLVVTVTGPKGSLVQSIRPNIDVTEAEGKLSVTRKNELKPTKSLHGTYRAVLANMVEGVANGYKRELEIVGIGYRAEQQGNKIVFSLGYAHKIELEPPAEISVSLPDANNVVVEGIDKQLVGEVAAKIRGYRPPEPYKGKGVRYKDEQVRRKSVKQTA